MRWSSHSVVVIVLVASAAFVVAAADADAGKEELDERAAVAGDIPFALFPDPSRRSKRVMLPVSKFSFLPQKIHLDLGQEGSTQPKRGVYRAGGLPLIGAGSSSSRDRMRDSIIRSFLAKRLQMALRPGVVGAADDQPLVRRSMADAGAVKRAGWRRRHQWRNEQEADRVEDRERRGEEDEEEESRSPPAAARFYYYYN